MRGLDRYRISFYGVTVSQLEAELRRAALQYVCHVKAAELEVSFEECWRAMFPTDDAPPEPPWAADNSRHLLVGMREKNSFVEALCQKYEI
ncbi:MAG: hypothetical protein EBY45_15650 [Gammaproteobacteria bacterium]|nr:hypothetical protein [Gammaproteobacteria bacterium]